MWKKRLRLVLIAFIAMITYSVLVEPNMLGITKHEVVVKGLPKEFDGLKIVQMSDIHMNFWTRTKRVRRIVERVNALDPDVVVLTGDFVSRGKDHCPHVGSALKGLKAKHGVYAVLGNHDYWTDPEMVTDELRSAGVDVLFDAGREITIGKESIWLVGTDDVWEGAPDYDAAFGDVSSEDVCIAIAHNPDAVLSMKDKPVSLLMVGHTHGGIINLPFVGPLLSVCRMGKAYSSGMFTVNGIRMYVSRGVGGGPYSRIRFRAQPEIPVFTLRRSGQIEHR